MSLFFADVIIPSINVLWIIVAVIVICALGIVLAHRWKAKARDRRKSDGKGFWTGAPRSAPLTGVMPLLRLGFAIHSLTGLDVEARAIWQRGRLKRKNRGDESEAG